MKARETTAPPASAWACEDAAREVPLTPEEKLMAKDICKGPEFAQSVVDARLRIDTPPKQLTGRKLADSLNELAGHLKIAGNELLNLPRLVRARLLSVAPGGHVPVPQHYDGLPMSISELAETLLLLSIISTAASKRVNTRGGRPVQHRPLYAITEAMAICKKYKLPFSATSGPAINIVNLILRDEISEDQFKRALAHLRKPVKKK